MRNIQKHSNKITNTYVTLWARYRLNALHISTFEILSILLGAIIISTLQTRDAKHEYITQVAPHHITDTKSLQSASISQAIIPLSYLQNISNKNSVKVRTLLKCQ